MLVTTVILMRIFLAMKLDFTSVDSGHGIAETERPVCDDSFQKPVCGKPPTSLNHVNPAPVRYKVLNGQQRASPLPRRLRRKCRSGRNGASPLHERLAWIIGHFCGSGR
eukprot:3057199-Karenia_brevis.AAC.1